MFVGIVFLYLIICNLKSSYLEKTITCPNCETEFSIKDCSKEKCSSFRKKIVKNLKLLFFPCIGLSEIRENNYYIIIREKRPRDDAYFNNFVNSLLLSPNTENNNLLKPNPSTPSSISRSPKFPDAYIKSGVNCVTEHDSKDGDSFHFEDNSSNCTE